MGEHTATATDMTETGLLRGTGGAAGSKTFAPGEEFRRHHHAHVTEVFVCTAGTITVQIGERTHVLAPGDVAVAPPGVTHQTANRSAELAEIFYIKTPPDMDDFVWDDTDSERTT
ncbi:cupin domain-containing protein [Georgenia yuyongxinii]|uniref:Cupin domain-containing protein n=1 Tax=Georgenia yuyongxinii TaxID=2589797 RepID=A0A552WR16_9MICO|nr:cupin domain-containing protein [Georgenia yuyongxinii]TRW45268.1 cupin domain-containing protein [Georgenia yuyongxinii]